VDGVETEEGIDAHFVPAPFRFCLRCGVSYGGRVISDFPKLGQLGSEGRSTATTILGMSAVRGLKTARELNAEARKLLSFTDNRQDASLQAGHFNDFIEVGLLRSALYRAASDAGDGGLRHEDVTQAVFAALQLDIADYAADPDVKFQAAKETQKALRDVLGYRLYRDQRRGWRITLPNLEQCGLLHTDYLSLDDLCAAEEEWAECHELLAEATPETREAVSRTLLDWMRRALALKVNYLEGDSQERIRAQSDQRLRPPWGIDDKEQMEAASVVLPRSRRPKDYGGYEYLSGRSGFGMYLNRPSTFPGRRPSLKVDDREQIILQLLEVLRVAGLVEVVLPAKDGDVPGYQVPAAALVWRAGDGAASFRDPLRMPQLPEGGGRTNEFFVAFYASMAAGLKGFEAREHTAQVPYELREEREERFRKGALPLLFCSPTMELGVDIAELNVVNMRNIPPTPANYAQRSGRAGRSGRPALVYSYCSTGSPHDQYFFRRPAQMVAGAVAPPRIDLANEDLVRAHVHAVWLKETGMSLGRSLRDLLDLEGEEPSLELLPEVKVDINNQIARERARVRAIALLAECREELLAGGWYSDQWLDEVLDQVAMRFDRACARWRDLYRAAHAQARAQGRIILDATRSKREKDQAKVLRREAEQQLALLTDVDNLLQSDFYSYRYFASEGFLPGYSFPRLPLSAFIPGSRGKKGDDEFLQRPRFLAISEFGPRAIVYHEGSRYIIDKAILPVREEGDLAPTRAKICSACGYLHVARHGDGPDLCEACGTALGAPRANLFRLQNVSTKRRDRITSDEEERQRFGYELITAVRFDGDGAQAGRQVAMVEGVDGTSLGRLTYGHTATIWRVNLGWARRKNKDREGFVLDTERGYWAKNQDDPIDAEVDQDPMSNRKRQVIPFVEDRRNCLLLEVEEPLTPEFAVSLQAALKRAIQVEFQLEDNELAVESLPHDKQPRQILLYEAAEGGAGALRQLLQEGALAGVAARALELCHFDSDTGEDRGPEKLPEPCEAACYDCLMSYQNQRYHSLLDRQLVRDVLLRLRTATVVASPVGTSRAEHLAGLLKLTDSTLEEKWLRLLEERNLNLPARAQVLIEECGTRPDFLYQAEQVVVYVDGPVHDFPERQARDAAQTAAMEDAGYTVIRFGHGDDWEEIVARYPYVFGGSR
jgi:very-short-patch-repair endonuclease